MGRFISNFELYSKRIPEKFILVILPGDESRNIRSLQDTPFWGTVPRQPSAIMEVLRFLTLEKFVPKLSKENKVNSEISGKENKINSSNLSVSGSVVNLYNALILASSYN